MQAVGTEANDDDRGGGSSGSENGENMYAISQKTIARMLRNDNRACHPAFPLIFQRLLRNFPVFSIMFILARPIQELHAAYVSGVGRSLYRSSYHKTPNTTDRLKESIEVGYDDRI